LNHANPLDSADQEFIEKLEKLGKLD